MALLNIIRKTVLCFSIIIVSCQNNSQKTTTGNLTCYFFISPDCPASINYIGVMEKYIDQYEGHNINFKIVYPEKSPAKQDIQKAYDNFKLKIPLIIDSTLELTRTLKATVTPQVVFSSEKNILYSGSIDDYYYALSKHRNYATKHYLRDAIEQTLKGENIVLTKTTPFGCRIKFN